LLEGRARFVVSDPVNEDAPPPNKALTVKGVKEQLRLHHGNMSTVAALLV
jgi:hypothetical protein